MEFLSFGSRLHAKVEGYGICLAPNQVRVGSFHEGRQTGNGVLFWKDGATYEGEFLNGRRHGRGKQVEGPVTHEGEWVEGEMTGTGSSMCSDGTMYQGDYLKGDWHGKGNITWPDGFNYNGEWENHQPKDDELSVHPSVRDCISRKVCTGEVTGTSLRFPQFLGCCEVCERTFCLVCWQNCHSNLHEPGFRRWFVGSYCMCEKCNLKDVYPPAKKQRLS